MKPKKLSRKIVETNKWTTVVKEQMLFENGKKGEYVIVERQPAIMIIPLVKSGGKKFTFLVKQYRYPIDKEIWQFPMGTLEPSSDPAQHAKKELKEETGLLATKIKLVGKFYVDPGLSRQECFVYVAENVTEGGEQELEETEKGMKVAKFEIEEINRMLQSNSIKDSWGYSGLTMLQDYLKKE